MPAPQKLPCAVDRIVAHGDHVYSITLRPSRPAPRFRAGQFLHLALDPYDPTGFWPESRVFSIASSTIDRATLKITYAVHGVFTARMERELAEGREIWIKMPYGDFVVDGSGDVALLAGGTGVTAFTAFLEDLPADSAQTITVAYGAREAGLLIYKDVVDRCRARVPSVDAHFFVEAAESAPPAFLEGRVSVDAIWPRLPRPASTSFYISGPPAMLRDLGSDLRARQVPPEAIYIDAWE